MGVFTEIEEKFNDLSNITSPNIIRELKFLKIIGNGALEGEDQDQVSQTLFNVNINFKIKPEDSKM